MPPAISIQHLSKRYQLGRLDLPGGGSFREMLTGLAKAPRRRLQRLAGKADHAFWALDDVSLDIAPGEVVAVVGRNGAGKSTLLKILSRITEPTRGRVELRGRVASLLEVGTGFHPDLTGRENIFLNGAILGMSRAEIRRKFDAIVEFAEVAAFLDTAVKHYSSGMYLRLAFGVAAHLDGEIMLVDEVLAVGDAAFQKKCLGKIHDVSRGGRTVVFVSHNMAAVSSLCTRGVVFERGRVAFDGLARDAVQHYLLHHLADGASAWDVADTPRANRDLGEQVRLERIAALDGGAGGFAFGAPMRFQVTLRTSAAVDRLACALGLDDVYGSRIVTFESDREGLAMSLAAGSRREIDVTVPAFGLAPGRYLLSVSVYSGGRYYDYVVHPGAIAIVPDGDAARITGERSDRGPIQASSEWRIHTAEAAIA